jgi:hypothetical protein
MAEKTLASYWWRHVDRLGIRGVAMCARLSSPQSRRPLASPALPEKQGEVSGGRESDFEAPREAMTSRGERPGLNGLGRTLTELTKLSVRYGVP